MRTALAVLVGAALVGCGGSESGASTANARSGGLLPRDGYCTKDALCARLAGTDDPWQCYTCEMPPVYDERCRSYAVSDCEPAVYQPEWEGQGPWVMCPPLPGETLAHTPCPLDWLHG